MRATRLLPALGATALAAWLAMLACAATLSIDELDELYSAVRMGAGALPYRDFFEFAAPGPLWLAQALFAVTGPSLGAARVLQAAVIGLTAGLLAGLARRLGVAGPAAWVPGACLAVGFFRLYPAYYHHWLALACMAGALAAGLRALQGGRLGPAAAAGALAALAGLCTQTDGLLAIAALGGALAVGLAGRAIAPAEAGRLALAGAAGFAGPLAIAALPFAWAGSLGQAWASVWLWPLAHYRTPGGFNDVALFSDLVGYRPYMAAHLGDGAAAAMAAQLAGLYLWWPAAAAAGLAWAAAFRRASAAGRRALLGEGLVLAAAAGAIGAVLNGRADAAHVAMYDAFPALAAWVGARRLAPRGQAAAGAAVALFLAGAVGVQAQAALERPDVYMRAALPDARLAARPDVAAVLARSQPADRIVAMHAGGLFYFFARPAATRYTVMYPPYARYNTAEEYAAFLADVAAARPKLVVLAYPGPFDEAVQALLPTPLAGYRLVEALPPGPEGNATYVLSR